jgi:hypothetical protein
MDANTHLK